MSRNAFTTPIISCCASSPRRNGWARAVAAALLLAAPVSAQAGDAQSVEVRAASLKPGEFVWRDDVSRAGPVAVVISLPAQMAYIYRGGELLGVSTVSTGKAGKRTPVGSFTILQKKVFHRSNLYSNAPMPYMQRLTWTGIAMHAGDLPGYPASHGCIRFPAAFAKKLYDLTDMGGEVRVIDTALPGATLPAPKPALPPVLVADAGLKAATLRDERVTAAAVTSAPSVPTKVATPPMGAAVAAIVASPRPAAPPGPRIDLAANSITFAAYDAVFAAGYGAKGARTRPDAGRR
ncbi:L,D-transpeptidase family protein [Sphingomonas baiyangensis]|uniref:L,D-TPase catalytic domain-containing protein n=1 Tax=Sphingomonas baiyangensis TaxID=2572576 RepID=A0A4U1L221_9SPHN|nr:L,D-transpeptidase family protein [Sphingomonas baiyangensis]TKD50642.1 hypothetical protein FBR43_07575 [Sphingomonas baiyangensis]